MPIASKRTACSGSEKARFDRVDACRALRRQRAQRGEPHRQRRIEARGAREQRAASRARSRCALQRVDRRKPQRGSRRLLPAGTTRPLRSQGRALRPPAPARRDPDPRATCAALACGAIAEPSQRGARRPQARLGSRVPAAMRRSAGAADRAGALQRGKRVRAAAALAASSFALDDRQRDRAQRCRVGRSAIVRRQRLRHLTAPQRRSHRARRLAGTRRQPERDERKPRRTRVAIQPRPQSPSAPAQTTRAERIHRKAGRRAEF